MTDPLFHNLVSHANRAMEIATARGYAVPKEYLAAKAVALAAVELAAEPAVIGVPAALPSADELPEYCDEIAAQRITVQGRKVVAGEIRDRAVREAANFALAAAPTFAQQLVTEANDTMVPEFLAAAAVAQQALSGDENATQYAMHGKLIRTARVLSSAAGDRAELGLAIREQVDLDAYSLALFMLVDPPPTTFVSAIRDAITGMKRDGPLPQNFAAWITLMPLNISFARVGEAASRIGRYNAALAASVNTNDGGMLDHTLGELLGED